MPWKLEYYPAEHTVHIMCSGPLTTEDLIAQTDAANKLRTEHGAEAFLADFTGAQVQVPLADIMHLPDYYAEIGLPRQNRIAVVFPPDFYQYEKYEFYEDVCLNRGYHSRLFDCVERAQEWLAESCVKTA